MFRPEAITNHADHLSGDVGIAVPIAWQCIGYLIFGGVAIAFAFLSLASYSRVETVAGTITPDTGVPAIMPTRSGVIAALTVKDGQDIVAGTELATIRAEEDSASGLSAADEQVPDCTATCRTIGRDRPATFANRLATRFDKIGTRRF